jgi:hypothetical protein
MDTADLMLTVDLPVTVVNMVTVVNTDTANTVTVDSTDTASTVPSTIQLPRETGSGVTVPACAKTVSVIPAAAMVPMVPVVWTTGIGFSNVCLAGPSHREPVVRVFLWSANTTWSTPISQVM